MQQEPDSRELRAVKWQLRRRRIRERLGAALGFRGKTVWDLLQLLIIPALLAGLALWFNNQTSTREQERSLLQRENDQKIAEDRAREEALQSYLNVFEGLLLQYDLRTSEPGDEVRSVARARTLAVLRGLDGARKGALVKFLYESRLIDKDNVVVNLEEADLSGAHLSGANLRGAYLGWTNLSGANLVWTNLNEADLTWAILSDADLGWAILNWTDLGFSDLSGADLRSADMNEADLSGADLSEAYLFGTFLLGTYLSSADLEGADLRGSFYDKDTLWPTGFDPEKRGAEKWAPAP